MCYLEPDVDSGGGCTCWGTEGVWKLSVLSTQFFSVNLKQLKITKFKNKKNPKDPLLAAETNIDVFWPCQRTRPKIHLSHGGSGPRQG